MSGETTDARKRRLERELAAKHPAARVVTTTRRTFGILRTVYVARCGCGFRVEARTELYAIESLDAHRTVNGIDS